MKNNRRLIAIIIATALVVAGGILTGIGMNGRSIYSEATNILGCKQPETIGYMQNPNTVDEVNGTLPAEVYSKFLIDRLGFDSAEVQPLIDEIAVYNQKVADANDTEKLTAYVADQMGLSHDEAAELLSTSTKMAKTCREGMIEDTVMEALDCDYDHFVALTEGEYILPYIQEGFTKLMIGYEAEEIFGCSYSEAVDRIENTDLISEIARGLSKDTYTKFLVNRLGYDTGEVETVVSEFVTYDQKLSESNNDDNFIKYIVTHITAEDGTALSEEAAQELLKDMERAAELREEMLVASVIEALDCDDEHVKSLAEGTDMLNLIVRGLDRQDIEVAPESGLFHNAILFTVLGLVMLVFGFAILFIQLMEGFKKGKKGTVKVSPKAAKIGEFFLNYALYIILIAILVVVCLVKPNFLDPVNILNILKQASTKGILALGCAGLIVLAGTDLSIGRVLGFSAAVTAALVQSVTYSSRMFPQMTQQLPLFVPLLASIAVAVIFSLINGFGVAKLHLHAFIITLGTQLIAYGCNCLFIESQPSGTAQALSTFDQNFLNFAAGNLTVGSLKIPLVVIYFLVIAIVMWFVWNKTRLGKNMFAVGGNTEAAAVSGVNVAKTIMMVYLVAGILYGISAFLEAARITSVGANTGINYETDAISAVVVGGVSFSGGVGTIQGVVIGAIILQAINYSLQFLGVNPYLQYVVRGLIIILAVAIDVRKYIAKK